jgi:hypothetical protein
MSVLLALAAAALPLDGEVYFPVRIDCDLVSARSKGKYDRTSSKLTLLFPFEAAVEDIKFILLPALMTGEAG